MGRYVFLSVLVVVMTVVQTLLYFFTVARVDKQRHDFYITKDIFVGSVSTAVTNFLSSLLPQQSIGEPSSPTLTPSLQFVDRLSTWESFAGVAGCDIDGTRYGVGDYSQYGLILSIQSGRVYCSNTNGVVILRARAPASAPCEPVGRAGAETPRL